MVMPVVFGNLVEEFTPAPIKALVNDVVLRPTINERLFFIFIQ